MPCIIGTAGHIDHGKTQLIKALTGQDTDRLKEEKERGISIDLGFAYMDLTNGERVGIVDVPGHERFIRNMLAGAHGIDLVLLVIAADDGVMPQTEEHLDIAHLLGVERGIVAVSKIDVVDDARVEEVKEEIGILLAGTRLEGSPIVPLSAVTGAGIDRLRSVIEASLAGLRRHHAGGAFRMPIDRAFVMHGHGTIVTGTAVSGKVRAGDQLCVLPEGEEVRVRTVQVHEHEVDEAVAGQRVALNVVGSERARLGRGQVICAPGYGCVSDRIDARVEIRPGARKPVKSHARLRIHLGTDEVLGKVVWLDGKDEVAVREGAYGQIVLRRPINAVRGDRFIIRDETAQRTVGGGIIIHPLAKPHRRGDGEVCERLAALQTASSPADIVRALSALESDPATELEWLARAAGLTTGEVRTAVISDCNLRPLPSADATTACTTAAKWTLLKQEIVAALQAFHRREPLLPGVEMESLRTTVARDLSAKLFRALIDALAGEHVIAREQSLLRLPSHRVALRREEADAAAKSETMIVAGGVTPPSLKEIETAIGIARPKLLAVLKQLERERRVTQVDADLWFGADSLERARSLIRTHIEVHGQIDAATFRDLLGASRKFSIALLDYFDRTGFTMRVGDIRRLRKS